MTLAHLMQKVRDAAAGGIGAMSTGEAVAVALVLNRPDWLAERGFTLAGAVRRLDEGAFDLIPVAERQWCEEEDASAHVTAISAHAAAVADLFGIAAVGSEGAANTETVYLDAQLVTVGDAPGYRRPSLVFDARVINGARSERRHRINLTLRPQDGEPIVRHILDVHRFAWRAGKRPLDATDDEQYPHWIDGRS